MALLRKSAGSRVALNRKGWRNLRLEEQPLYWRTRAVRDAPLAQAVHVCVVSGQAFKSGQTGQQLNFVLPRGSTVGPALLRYVVTHSPQFTGAAGLPHVNASARVEAHAARMALSPRRDRG
jgi:hypothetical protein